MTNTKMTSKMALDFVLTSCDVPSEVREKLEAMKASIEKKAATKSTKPTATQTENAGFKVEIAEFLSTVDKALITDIMKSVPSLSNLSNQRVSAIVRQMVLSGEVVRTEDKRKAYFSLAD